LPAADGSTPSAPQMRSIKLTCEQRRVLLAMRELYLRNMGALVRRRQQLSAELQVMSLQTALDGAGLIHLMAAAWSRGLDSHFHCLRYGSCGHFALCSKRFATGLAG